MTPSLVMFFRGSSDLALEGGEFEKSSTLGQIISGSHFAGLFSFIARDAVQAQPGALQIVQSRAGPLGNNFHFKLSSDDPNKVKFKNIGDTL